MSRQTIFTYSKKYFNELYNEREKQGIKLISLSQVTSKSLVDEYIDDGFNIEIDISSLVTFLKKNDDAVYQFESYFNTIIGEEITFVVEESYAKDTLDLFSFTFDKSDAMAHFSSNEGSIINENNKETQDKLPMKIVDLTNNQLQDLYDHIDRNIFGHNDFKKTFIEKVRSFRIFNNIGDHKILSVFLLGPSGVGKTEFAREVHKFFDSSNPLIKINFGNYSSMDSLNSLIGSPRGYMGSEDGELSIRIKRSSVGIILIDEFEKANEKVFNFFLELLEEGRFTNSLGEEFDLNGYMIVFTSNLSRKEFSEKLPPELRSRFDLKSEFTNLSVEDKESYFFQKLDQLINRLDIDEKETIKQEIILEKQEMLTTYKNLREINKVIRDEITKRMYIQIIV